MTKKLKWLTTVGLAVCFSAAGCAAGGGKTGDPPPVPDGTPAYTEAIEVSGMKYTPGGKPYLEVNGTPMLMLGGQLRTDFFLNLNKKKPTELDDYFKLASQMNVTVVQVPIAWRDVEPRRGQYTTELVGHYIDYCNKYDLKLELLWFGSYMCGYSCEGYIPDYVVQDRETYPAYEDRTGNVGAPGWLGWQYWLRADTDALVEREAIAMGKLMDGIWEYDRMHGGRRTIVGIQVENEPDMLATRHNGEHGYSEEEIWPSLVKMLDKLGQTVKNSKYKCYTRVNMTTDSDYTVR